ncbi:Similar to RNA exonuclease 3; acc. no. Q4WYA1 [Pyronema omphalodes CBS 100304]|uniref:Similar to RNA exonuclease 3 acc. no. Q4WYA1 n=1 Tax=Pyronema omphalodes (strain CBS 100304) TaxID=1076935 RepID=U4LHW7_PYROM|nr:Similar to RNA exonuclease 3; acc. no. Q4WYA1 [Pyronema omphalodes CBS 100304]
MFRPLNLFSDAADNPVPCPALLDNLPCPILRCLFSHELKPPPRGPPSLSQKSNAVSPVTVDQRSHSPPARPAGLSAAEKKLKEIVEGKKTQDITVGKRKAVSPQRSQQGVITNPTSDDGHLSKRRASGATSLAEVSDIEWPTLAQSAGKPSRSKSPDTSPTTKAASSRTLKRPASGSPIASTPPKTDPLKRPKVTAPSPTPKATAPSPTPKSTTTKTAEDAKTKATAMATQTLNPRLVARSPAPHAQRLKYLQILQAELTRLSGNPKSEASQQKIIMKCLDLEEEIATKKREIYRQSISNLCMRYKKATPADYAKELEEEKRKAAPPPEPTPLSRFGLDNNKPALTTGLPKAVEITRLKDFIHKPEVLKTHGYILTPPTAAEIASASDGVAASGGYEQCERCMQRFQVFPGRRESDGALTTCGNCVYHHGRKFLYRSSKAATTSEQRWSCCQSVVGFDPGCETAPHHVFKVSSAARLALSLNFAHTPVNPKLKAERALALDCEMGYTTHGLELVRITATAFPSGKTVIDALVKPYGVILDLNSRFSGVTAEMMRAAPPWKATEPYPDAATTDLLNPTMFAAPKQLGYLSSPELARKALWHYIGPETVLIGHALENDLMHLRMCHENVVDTIILFPHVKGFPMRNKLKFLVERELGREIQQDSVIGHDSATDARCAAELVRRRIRDEEERKK